jgi:thiol:disulfide interchange protein DsbD
VEAPGSFRSEYRRLMRIFFKGGNGMTGNGAPNPQDTRSGRRLARALAVAVLGGLPGAVVACGQPNAPAAPGPGGLVSVKALSDVGRVGPGQTFHVAILFDLEPKWHIYWKNPGEGAMPPRITVEAPPGFEVASPLWPRPIAVEGPIGPEYCYFDEVALFVPVKAPPRLDEGRVTLQAHVDWAVCKNVCRLGSADLSVVVETAARADPAPPTGDADPVLRRYRRRLPRALDEAAGAAVSFDGALLTVSGPAAGTTSAEFFPDQCPGVTYGRPRIEVRGDRFFMRVSVDLDPNNALGQPMVIGGLVALGRRPEDPCYDFELPADVPSSP